ncbi:MAG: hypothetical protein L3J24_02390 [Xanthomonadales bacterium]|nr:hypothetical protein [Xanthomonadales bacterium]
MQTDAIEKQIRESCDFATVKGDLMELLDAVAARQQQQPTKKDLETGARFICDYIEQVPYMIKIAITSAINVGLEKEINCILAAVISYWDNDNDVIPDHMGVIGLMDDAYCSLSLLQSVSDHYRLQTGKFMFPADLTTANQAMREIIGDPYAAELDRFIFTTLHEAAVMEAVKALADQEKQLYFDMQGTIWSHDSAEAIDIPSLKSIGLL